MTTHCCFLFVFLYNSFTEIKKNIKQKHCFIITRPFLYIYTVIYSLSPKIKADISLIAEQLRCAETCFSNFRSQGLNVQLNVFTLIERRVSLVRLTQD